MNKNKLRHVVLFKFKENAPKEAIEQVEKAFSDLKNKIPFIQSLEWGTDVSPEGISQGFTHCFFVTFKNEEDRNAYLPHPEHVAFGGVLKPIIEKVLVVDYWTRD